MKRLIVLLILIIQFHEISYTQTTQAPYSANYQSYLSDKLSALWSFVTGKGFLLGSIPVPYEIKFSNSPDISGTYPNSFDLRSTNNVTHLKNQGSCGSCWAFATMGAIESEWKVAGYGTFDLSENSLIHGSKFLYSPCEGGDINMSIAYLSRMAGPINSVSDPYNPSGNYYISNVPPIAYVSDVRFIKWRSNSGIKILKQAIIDHGGLYTTMRWEDGSYNSTNYTYYYNGIKAPNHAVVIVGWDNSIHTAIGDGAWIIKNSWANFGDNGYFYVSYLDNRILSDAAAYFPNRISYNSNAVLYEYDELGATRYRGFNSSIAYGLVKFTATCSMQLSKISTWIVSENTTVDIEVYADFDGNSLSNLITSLYNKTCENPGYYTFDLPIQTTINKGQNFFIKIKYNAPYTQQPLPCEEAIPNYANPSIETGKCWVSADGKSWTGTGIGTNEKYDLCIKAYTIKNPISISQIEYFIDFDPGFGKATVLNISTTNDISGTFNIPLDNNGVGIHILYVRAKDNNNKWSITQNIPFYSLKYEPNPKITGLEYFIDADPGLSNGIPITFSADSNVIKSFNINLKNFQTGIHTLYLRAKNQHGEWSIVQTSIFYCFSAISTQITQLEYFIDSDPGQNKGIPISFTVDTNVIKLFNIDLTNIQPGIHTLYLRAKNRDGKWSVVQTSNFYCFFGLTPKITKLEYFIDSDPGQGNGVNVSTNPSSNLLKQINIDLTVLTPGFHSIYIRAKDQNGKWGIVQNSPFYNFGVSELKSIKKLEYFVDSDPGFDLAKKVTITSSLSEIKQTFIADLSGYSKGGHMFFARVADSQNHWSILQSKSFTICDPPDQALKPKGTTQLCANSQNSIYTTSGATGSTSYIWRIYPTNAGVITGSTTSATVDWNNLFSGNAYVSVRGHNDCSDGAVSDSLHVSISAIPLQTPIITLNGDVLHSNAINGNQWYNKSGLITGATSQDYTPKSSGDYYMIVSINGCSSNSSNSINFIATGIEPTELSKSIKVYPNPISNELVIEIQGSTKKTDFEILNSISQVVFKGNIVDKTVVQTTSFPPGVYLIKLKSGELFEFKKIIKK